jgi:hypothetical protein
MSALNISTTDGKQGNGSCFLMWWYYKSWKREKGCPTQGSPVNGISAVNRKVRTLGLPIFT